MHTVATVAAELAAPEAATASHSALRPLPAHRLSVVVPMYNEAENVEPLVDAIQAALSAYPWPWELVLVDDGSSDGTGALLERHARRVGEYVRVVRLLRNFKQTAAMQAGIDAARGDVIVTMDGDLQNDPRDIPRLTARLLNEPLDMVAGWRQQRQDGWLLRRLPSWLANRLIRQVSGLNFQDLGCSLKAFRAPVLKQVRLYGEMHRFIPAWLATVTSPARMAEEPVRHHPRQHGRSKYGLSRGFRVLVDLLAIHFFLRFGTRPGHFFGGIGLAVLSIGLLILGYLGVLKLGGESVGTRPLLGLGFFCVMGGLQFLTTGVLAELLMRVYFDRGQARPYHAMSAEPLDPREAWHGRG
jgi:glycosyltransferase involved in cell wall biosynthesis